MKKYQPDFDLTKLGFFSGTIEIDKTHQVGLLQSDNNVVYYVPLYWQGRAWTPYTSKGKAIAYGSYQAGGAVEAHTQAVRHIRRTTKQQTTD